VRCWSLGILGLPAQLRFSHWFKSAGDVSERLMQAPALAYAAALALMFACIEILA
jgi:hypothetical protein